MSEDHNSVFCLFFLDELIRFFLIYSRASDFGLLKIDQSGKIVQFSEKPKGDDLKAMVMISFVCQNVHYASYTQLIFLLASLHGNLMFSAFSAS